MPFRNESTRRRVVLYRGVYPVAFDVTGMSAGRVEAEIIRTMQGSRSLMSGMW